MAEDFDDPDMNDDTKEQNVYKKKVRDNLIDDDEISPEEEAFMEGYEEAEDESYKE